MKKFNGSMLNEARASCRVTYEELATKSGVPYSTVSRLLSNKAPASPAMDTVECMLKVINKARESWGFAEIKIQDLFVLSRLTLPECLQECLGWLNDYASPMVTMNVIALEMTQGMDALIETINHITPETALNINLLMLADRLTQLPEDPTTRATLQTWSQLAGVLFTHMTERFEPYDATRHRVRIEVRRYSCSPMTHGVLVMGQTGETICFVTDCQLNTDGTVPQFFWTDGYTVIKSGLSIKSLATKKAIFESQYQGLWQTARPEDTRVLGC